jgi:hypothetical protein
MDSTRQAVQQTTRQEGGAGDDVRLVGGRQCEASDVRQSGGGRHNKRTGVEDMQQS